MGALDVGALDASLGMKAHLCAGPFMATSKSPSRCTSLGPHGKKGPQFFCQGSGFEKKVFPSLIWERKKFRTTQTNS